MKSMIYLDHAATTPIDKTVLKVMMPYLIDDFYNPSATYLPARKVKDAVNTGRERIAHWLGVRPSEIIFTAGGTEANNLAIQGVLRAYPNCSAVVSAVEHDSVLAPANMFRTSIASVNKDGRVDLENLKKKITEDTVLVSVMAANNEVGTVQPLREIAAIIAEEKLRRRKNDNSTPLYFHTDACQAGNYLDLHVDKLGVDMMTLNGSKLYGPKQVGVLYVGSHVRLEPLVYGGGQERGLRSGTENVAGVIGFALALDMAQAMRHEELRRLHEIQEFAYGLITEKLPETIINGSKKYRLPNNLHITLPGTDNERVLLQLEQKGILAAAGSACSASDEEPSHVLKAMGVSETDIRSSLRITMGRSTQQGDVKKLIETLASISANL